MTFLVLWIAASAAVGWFGRKRVVGFWGFLILSLIVSPIVTGLFLLVSAPGKAYVAETEQRVAASFRSAGFVRPGEARRLRAQATGTSAASHVPPRVTRLVEAWLGVLLVFGGLYWLIGAQNNVALSLTGGTVGPLDALRLSFDIGTLGSGHDVLASHVALGWLASLQRLLVLTILALVISALISSQLAALQAKREAIAREAALHAAPVAEPAAVSPLAAARRPGTVVTTETQETTTVT